MDTQIHLDARFRGNVNLKNIFIDRNERSDDMDEALDRVFGEKKCNKYL